MMNDYIYLDNASTTKVDSDVLNEMLPYLTTNYGNPSSIHKFGKIADDAIELARKRVADSINADVDEIYFTSGGTESNNIALLNEGVVLSTPIEHHSIFDMDYIVKNINIDDNGLIDVKSAKEFIDLHPDIVSIMFVNNEIGTVQPIKQLCEYAHSKGVAFHTDAVQAFGHVPIDVKDLGVDMMSVSGHKFGAPKGIGFLYVSKDYKKKGIMFGGGQESGIRPGTENVAGIVGLGKACEIISNTFEDNFLDYANLKLLLLNLLKESFGYRVHFNGDITRSVPSTLNFRIDDISGIQLVEYLNQNNIFVSSGSACNSSNGKPSYVLKAIGLTDEEASNSIRVSFGTFNTAEDVEMLVKCIKEFVDMVS